MGLNIYEILLKSKLIYILFYIATVVIKFYVLLASVPLKLILSLCQFISKFVKKIFFGSISAVKEVTYQIATGDSPKPKKKKRKMSIEFRDFVMKKGYPLEQFVVQTKDNYFLQLHRIPCGREEYKEQQEKLFSQENFEQEKQEPRERRKEPKPVAFFMHGFMQSSASYVAAKKKVGLAFLLADLGYDCWFGNHRGNSYSDRHQDLGVKDDLFWDYSIDELIQLDAPTLINFVLDKTHNKSVTYIGFSQGTTVGFGAFSFYPELSSKINLFVSLAPCGVVKNPHTWFFKLVTKLPGKYIHLLFGKQAMIREISKVFLKYTSIEWFSFIIQICMSILFKWTNKYLDQKNMPVYCQQLYSPTSVKLCRHWFSILRTGPIHMFDYENEYENKKHYGTSKPPLYDLSKIKCPIALYYGENDNLINITELLKRLNSELVVETLSIKEGEHFDLLYGLTNKKQIYPSILKNLKKFNPTQKILQIHEKEIAQTIQTIDNTEQSKHLHLNIIEKSNPKNIDSRGKIDPVEKQHTFPNGTTSKKPKLNGFAKLGQTENLIF
ncbi:sterol esterase tgl1 [Anaeramoeba ignava]|uniref:Sterol esterase tgl1 n=1 Tax=Anaeramoeba ignava TaxID=1746090 RepID=A0A9Q0RBC9_ANAIG|nr:sterol esterase tgl1 [Anaeramoeba ignava]|eukprot:Anaeramoba_ignava/a479907_67.p1 GENE.a479907_67~~a479907_67.p1  ORF type:complete len:552 (+),score=164.35 a479907_67:78-1733(+)